MNKILGLPWDVYVIYFSRNYILPYHWIQVRLKGEATKALALGLTQKLNILVLLYAINYKKCLWIMWLTTFSSRCRIRFQGFNVLMLVVWLVGAGLYAWGLG